MLNLVMTAVLHGLARPDRNLTPVLLAVVVDSNCLDYHTTCIVHLLLNLFAHCLRCETLMHIRVYLRKCHKVQTLHSANSTQRKIWKS